MDDQFSHGIKQVSEVIQSYTYPLLRGGRGNHPEIFASCVFLEWNNEFFLATASHALRGNNSGLFTRGESTLIEVVGKANITRAEKKDHVDIAIIQVSKEFIQENNINVVTDNMYSFTVEVTNPHSRAVCGYPASKNKQSKILDRENKILTSMAYTYFGDPSFSGSYSDFEKSNSVHIGLEFEAGKDDRGIELSTPPWPPKGISGGGVWLVPDLTKPQQIFFEGIFIEGYKRSKRRLGFGTRGEYIIGFIDQTHNIYMNAPVNSTSGLEGVQNSVSPRI